MNMMPFYFVARTWSEQLQLTRNGIEHADWKPTMTYGRTGQGRRSLGAGIGLRPVSQYADIITDCRLPIDPPRFGPQSVGTQLLLRYD
jgi:hypothetical protein